MNITLIANDKVLIQSRGGKAAHGDNYIKQTSAASFVTKTMFRDSDLSLPHSLKLIMNQEMGKIENAFSELLITGVVRDNENYEVGITAFAETSEDVFGMLDSDDSKMFFISEKKNVIGDPLFGFMPLGAASIIKYSGK